MSEDQKSNGLQGPYRPALILHGGAGRITRPNLPPTLYKQYKTSLMKYLTSTRELLHSGANALTAAVHAVSLMEDDPLFNCGRGSVFTEKGTIEMEASVMVASVRPDAAASSAEANGGIPPQAFQKRGAGVMLVTQARHPIQLAEQMLIHTQEEVGGGSRHCQLSGPDIEETGFTKWGLERMGKDWFWTKKRWEEHLRGLNKSKDAEASPVNIDEGDDDNDDEGDGYALPSQGTVGCVCMDQWGNVAVATSTGGLTNKKAGRIGDTPTLGAGFWAEDWFDKTYSAACDPRSAALAAQPAQKAVPATSLLSPAFGKELRETFQHDLRNIMSCLPFANSWLRLPEDSMLPVGGLHQPLLQEKEAGMYLSPRPPQRPQPAGSSPASKSIPAPLRRAIAVSGTGNGDSFLRTAAGRTVGALARFQGKPLNVALPMVAGALGELQQSAGDRWGSGEGEGGIIGIEVRGTVQVSSSGEQPAQSLLTGEVVWDFNCGGMWRAFWDEEKDEGRVMVFKQEYEDVEE